MYVCSVFCTKVCGMCLCMYFSPRPTHPRIPTSGLPTNPVELNRVAIVLDPERIGVYNIDQVLDVLRPEKVKPKKEPKTDAEKIAVEVSESTSGSVCPTVCVYVM